MTKDILAALFGTLVGGLISASIFVLQWLLEERRQQQRARQLGEKFRLAIEAEIRLATERIKEKMTWISRDVSNVSAIDPRLVVKHENTLLFLGENETFAVSLSFWDHNLRDIVEVVDVESFQRFADKIAHIRAFVAKFADLKLAFQVQVGNGAEMALAVYQDLMAISSGLQRLPIPNGCGAKCRARTTP